MRKITICVLAAGVLLLLPPAVLVVLPPATASAGTYYMQVCPYYGQGPGPFTWSTDATSLSNPTCGIKGVGGVLYGRYAHWIAYSPPGIAITAAYTRPYQVIVDCALGAGSGQDGFTAQYFWADGAKSIDYLPGFGCAPPGLQQTGKGTGINQAIGPSNYFGWGATCSTTPECAATASGELLTVGGVQLQLTENSGPGILPVGSNNLWFQDGRWIRGGGWPVSFAAGDPSGVCGTDLLINWGFTSIDNAQNVPTTSSFQQCPSPFTVGGSLNTGANGPMTIEYAASNAAGVPSGHAFTVYVDNTTPTLALSTPNDADPNVWVNHPVRVVATSSGGPSGVAFTGCRTNDGPAYVYPAGGVLVNGTGVWGVQCTSVGNAVAVDGSHATSSTQTVMVHIDETPPAVAFAPVNPADPQAVVANTSDGQSGVAGGQIEMRPATDGSWQSLGTGFDGQHLMARFDDAALSPGPWLIQATSCDNAGNCASTDETVNLPVRTASVSRSGFLAANNPLRARRCVEEKVRVGRHHRVRRRRVCQAPRLVLKNQGRVSFGRSSVVHGVLTTATGVPIAGAPITIFTAPENGLYQYAPAASARTSSEGTWWTRLPPGPSRLIDAVYAGSPTIQPSQSWDHLLVPAQVKILSVWPRRVPWGATVRVKARLLGGFLPPGGALVRLRLGYGNAKITYGVKEHVGGDGSFQVTNRFGPGPASLRLRYWLRECTLPEGDYPFTPACGPRNFVTVGGG